MMLVDVDTLKTHLKITDTASDDDIEDKGAQASGIIQDYVKRDLSAYAVDGSLHDDLPAPIKSAVLLSTQALFDGGDPLSQLVRDLLHRQRDPAMA